MSDKKTSTIIKTFSDDIYIIAGQTPDEVNAAIAGMDEVRMPNGSYINRKAIASIQSYADYSFQVDQKQRHRKGQYLHRGNWHDIQGNLGISAQLEKITGDILLKAPGKNQLKKTDGS